MSNFILVVETIFGGAWEMFQIQVPGFSFTFADVILACGFATVALALFKFAFNAGGVFAKGSGGRAGSRPANLYISEERKNDEK